MLIRPQTATLDIHVGASAFRRLRTSRKNRRGTSAVEFAVVAPVFFMLVFGMIEFGRLVMVQQILTNAVREGTRRAILPGATTTNVTDAVNTYLAGSSINGATSTVSPDPSSATYGSSITVTVSVPFTAVSWVPPFFLGSTTLKAQCSMRTEQSNSSGS